MDGHIEDRNTNSRNLNCRDKESKVTGHIGVIKTWLKKSYFKSIISLGLYLHTKVQPISCIKIAKRPNSIAAFNLASIYIILSIMLFILSIVLSIFCSWLSIC